MKKIYSLAFIILFLASMASLAQERNRHYSRRPGTEPVIPASVRESNTRNPSAAAPAGTGIARLRTQGNGRARTQQVNLLTVAQNYYVSAAAEPWGSVSNNNAMNNVLGTGNWSRVTFDDPDVLTIFDPATNFIFLEGSDVNALELNDFLIANLAVVESWVSNGGRLLLNAAPNEGGDIDFGFNGTTLNYNNGQGEVHVAGPLFTDPNVLSTGTYFGGSFSHAHITGNDIYSLIFGEDDETIVLGEKLYGDGLVAFGGMTTSHFHDPQPDADNLMTNIVYHIANNNIEPSIPETAFFTNKTSMVANRTATIMDISSGYPTSRTWTITPSTFEYVAGTDEHSNRIKVKFKAPGAYTIKLKAANATGEDELIKEDYISVRIPYNFYWVGGSGYWSEYETHWAKSSGGTEFHDLIPTEDDNVFFDANSFTTDGEVVDMEDTDVYADNASFTGVTYTPELGNGGLYLNGSLRAPDPIKFTGWDLAFTSSEPETIEASGVQFHDENGIRINGKGSFEMLTPIISDGYLRIENGTVTTNGHEISVRDFLISNGENGSGTATIDLQNGELHVKGNFEAYLGNVYPFIGDVNLFLGEDGGEANFYNDDDVIITRMTLVGGSVEFHNDITIGHLTIMPGTEVSQDDRDTFIVGSIDIKGTAAQNISLHNCTIEKASGIVVGEYVVLNQAIATGGATFYADKNSTDNGGNDGWIFSTKETQNITFEEPDGKAYGNANFDLTASSSSGLAVTFEVVSGPATLSGNTVTITGVGEVTIKVSQEGDNDFTPAQDVLQSFVVAKGAQALGFTINGNFTFGQAPVALNATPGESGNTVVFTVVEGPGSISGNTLTINGAGVLKIKAAQEGNENYESAAVTRQIDVAKAMQTITFNPPASKTFGDAAFNLNATGGVSGNAVVFTVVSGPVTISGNTVTMIAAGPVTIKASQGGNDNYLPATAAQQTFCVNPAKPVVTITGLDTEAPTLTSTTADAYQWYNNGVAISGATGKTFSVSEGGVYTVLTNASTCASVASDAQVLVITGLEAALGTFVHTYPNPVVNELIIDMSAINSQHEATVALYDAAGRTLTTTKAKGSVSIPMATHDAGRYTVVVSFGKQRIAKHIIKK